MAAIDVQPRFLIQARRGDEMKFLLIKPRAGPRGDEPRHLRTRPPR